MKFTLPVLVLTFLAPVAWAAEKEVWYNAKGKVVKVTRAEKEKKVFVPLWEKREQALAQAREARRDGRVRHRQHRSRYFYGYPAYYGYGGYYGGYYGGFGYCYPRRSYFGSGVRFSGFYQGNGWSVRVGY